MEGKMNCDECKNLITISVFGKLTPEEINQLKAHFQDCPKCANIYARSDKLNKMIDQKDDLSLSDKEKSWQVIKAKALKQKTGWFGRFAPQKPVFQYAIVLLLLGAGFAAGYFFRSDKIKGSQMAQLRQEVSQIREITAASLVRQESLNMRLKEIGMSAPLTQSEKISFGYLLRSFIGSTEEDFIPAQTAQTSPLVDLALTLVRQINQSDVY
jgi:hypothetical protein